jgi:hypothetical protein
MKPLCVLLKLNLWGQYFNTTYITGNVLLGEKSRKGSRVLFNEMIGLLLCIVLSPWHMNEGERGCISCTKSGLVYLISTFYEDI